jgi:hypothetical protein
LCAQLPLRSIVRPHDVVVGAQLHVRSNAPIRRILPTRPPIGRADRTNGSVEPTTQLIPDDVLATEVVTFKVVIFKRGLGPS